MFSSPSTEPMWFSLNKKKLKTLATCTGCISMKKAYYYCYDLRCNYNPRR